jgi:1-deoxyxylulose-5-phosphate synthase
VPIMAYSPIEQGRLLDDPTLVRVAERHGATPAQVALAWVLRQPAVTAPIIGANQSGHLEDAVAAVELDLSADEVAQLEEPYAPHPVVGFS